MTVRRQNGDGICRCVCGQGTLYYGEIFWPGSLSRSVFLNRVGCFVFQSPRFLVRNINFKTVT